LVIRIQNSILGLDLLENCVLISGSLDQSLKFWEFNQNNVYLLSSANTSFSIQTLVVSPQAISGKLKVTNIWFERKKVCHLKGKVRASLNILFERNI
jgi:hypothetical protein